MPSDDLTAAISHAIWDPGSLTDREPLSQTEHDWRIAAVLTAVRPFLARPTDEQMLREFHSGAGLPLPDQPTARPELGSQTGRARILAEEVKELGDAIDAGDITEIADACADVVYAAVGTAVTYGIPFDEVFRAVHKSNMTKLIPPVLVNGDGKIVKGSFWPDGMADSAVDLDAEGRVLGVHHEEHRSWDTSRVVFAAELAEEDGEGEAASGLHPA